ncbi:hypothetical protein IWQ60_003757 [Tieghemiomyces parasiticus]|uniref:B box-type domain-containing protein n=1 Tax=Tieghemiomyces parasiticus TaxID=78921 RepID=A0A9W8A913_9FUNG|nr:hypothetical protein IWQ60_003757 [Tieghemiomyces parasiticus]
MDHDDQDDLTLGTDPETSGDEVDGVSVAAASRATAAPVLGEDGQPLYCTECQDQGADVHCEQCDELFCEVCCAMLHRTGKRRAHTFRPLRPDAAGESLNAPVADPTASAAQAEPGTIPTDPALKVAASEVDFNAVSGEVTFTDGGKDFSAWIGERAKFIPLRLTLAERKYLRLLEAALNVSEYTDRVDILSYGNKSRRMVTQIKDLCAILSGLLLASDYRAGRKLFEDRAFAENADFFEDIFEIGRRHKIMNPEKMRDAYGKLMYLLQDSMIPEVQDLLQFSCVKPVTTVHSYLEDLGGIDLLKDPLVAVATREIIADGKPRPRIQAETRQKEQAVETLCRKYASADLPKEAIRQCLYSIGDNHSYLRTNRDPCDKVLSYLARYFSPDNVEHADFSLAIAHGRSGARLSHDHSTQYHYVKQTLSLWREVAHEMFMLWSLADQDLLSARNPYRLKDTGQGLNRVQASPRVSRAIHTILHRAQKSAGYWVGSSVVHLADHNVPNALMFIDKYNQVASILNPVVTCLQYLDTLPAALNITENGNHGDGIPRPAAPGAEGNGTSTGGVPVHTGTPYGNASANSSTSSFFANLSSTISSTLTSTFGGHAGNGTGSSTTGPIYTQPHYRQHAQGLYQYIVQTFGSVESCKKLILADFFRYAFDGSGGDNFYDAGSCIDGRLTSAWNWCSQIEKKPYYPVFLLSGFVGFNGEGY